jgi:Uma2 family endonuclease
MNAVPQRLISVEEFFSWLVDQEGRFELVNGRIRMMTGATHRHNVVKNNITVALTPAARKCGCSSTTSDMGVQTGPRGVRYPGVVVDCGPQDPAALIVNNAVILIEVSSPGIRGTDLTVKLFEYQNLASVQIIVQVEPDLVDVAVHRRAPDGSWQLEVHENLDDEIDFPPLHTSLGLRDIYFGLDVKPRPALQLVS